MTVTESLYQRHDELEAEFANCLLPELEKEAKGKFSMFLLRRLTPYFDGRTYRSEEVKKVELLYKELVALTKKLGEPISPGPVAIVRRYELLPNCKDLNRER